MDAKTFFNYVEQMRKHQKDFFRTKSKESLRASKEYEKIIDDEIARVENIVNNKQMKLGL